MVMQTSGTNRGFYVCLATRFTKKFLVAKGNVPFFTGLNFNNERFIFDGVGKLVFGQ